MTPRRMLGATALAAALVITACAGGSDDTASPVSEPSAASTSTTSVDPPPTSEAAAAPQPLSYPEMQEAQRNGEITEATLILSEFSVLFGVDLDGALPIARDESAPISGSHVLREIREMLPSLPEDQQAIVEQTLTAVTSGDVVYRSLEDESYLEAVALGKTPDDDAVAPPAGSVLPVDTEPQGFGRGPAPARVDPAIARGTASLIGTRLQRNFGGPALDFITVVAPESAARAGTVEALTDFLTHPTDGRSCRIVVYDRSRIAGAYLTSVLGHEVMHCWQHVNGPSATFIDTMVHYYSEGLATWVGEQIAGGTDFGRSHARNYLAATNYPLYTREYSAFGFWSEVAELRGGPAGLWTIIPSINAVADQPEAIWNAALEGVSDADRALLASGPLRRPDWSSSWDMDGKGITNDARPVNLLDVSPAGVSTVDVRPGAQTAGRFDLSGLATDTSWIVSIKASTESAIAAWDTGQEFRPSVGTSTDYCYGGNCECPDGSVPLPDVSFPPFSATAVTIAVSGSAFENANVVVGAVDIEEFCGEEVDDPDLDGGQLSSLVGTWRANPESVAHMFELASSAGGAVAGGIEVAGVTGDVLMTLNAGGSGSLVYRDVAIFINNELLGELNLRGGGSFNWDAADGQLRVQGGDFTVDVSSPSLGEVFTLTDEDVGGSGGTSTFGIGPSVNPNLVLLNAEGNRGDVFFPLLWIKQ